MKSSVSKKRTGLLVLITLSVIPLITLVSSVDTIGSRQKEWYGGDYDPSYAYLYNSLNIATFRLVGHFDHPGTPMQVTGAAVLWGIWIFSTDHEKSLTEEVISNPEYYLKILDYSVALITTLTLLLLSLIIWNKTKKLWVAVAFQLSPFTSGIILYTGFTRTSQEAFLLISSLMFTALIVIWYITNGLNQSKYLYLFAIISGLGIASKIIFAPLMVVPFILISTFKERKRFLIYTIISFIIFTLPILPLYPRMGWWIIKLFIHSGIYGSGSATILDTSGYATSLGNLIISEPAFTLVYSVIFIALLTLLIVKWTKGLNRRRDFRLLFSIFLTITIGFIITAKHPKPSYLLPYEILSVAGLIIVLQILLSQFRSVSVIRVITLVIVVPLVYFGIKYGIASKEKLYSTANNHEYEEAWESALTADAVIGVNPGPSPIAAAYFANTYSRNHYDKLLRKTYPNYYVFDTYNKHLLTFDGIPVTIETIRIIHGDTIAVIGTDVNFIVSLMKTKADLEVVQFIPDKSEVGFLHF